MEFILRAVKRQLRRWAPDALYVALVNSKCAIKRRAYRLRAAEDGLYRVDDAHGETIFISQRPRHSRYKRGISAWADKLATQYCLDQAQPKPGGVLIDCGANVGEIGVWARKQGLVYHAFEPEEREARCCDLNNFDGNPQTNRMGLWFETGELKLYSKGESADSSLIPIDGYDSVFVVTTKTLDEYILEHGITDIQVLKVEAEGAEPEVLCGASEALKITRYVAVDCGRERGIDREDTIREVCNRLYGHGFQMVDNNMDRFALLFEKATSVTSSAA